MPRRAAVLGFLIASSLLFAACMTPQSTTSGGASFQATTGEASYYADKFVGRSTASGETYVHDELTAAHRTLPFGTRVRVTRLDTGASVVVRVNDRGPFVRGRIIDLSKSAARRLDMLADGVVDVRIEPAGGAGDVPDGEPTRSGTGVTW